MAGKRLGAARRARPDRRHRRRGRGSRRDVPERRGVPRRSRRRAASGGSGTPPVRPEGFVWPDDGPGFRPEQHVWQAQFPFPGSGALNRLCVHPNDRRLRRARAADGRHRPLPNPSRRRSTRARPTTSSRCTPIATTRGCRPMSDPWYRNLETFLYLSDVDEGNAADASRAARRLPATATPPCWGVMPQSDPELYAAELPAPGVRGSLLAYRNDVFHRGVDLTAPGPRASSSRSRSSARARTGSATRRSSRSRRRPAGSSSRKARRHASSSSSASRRPVTRSGPRSCSTRPRSATRNSIWVRGGDRYRDPVNAPDIKLPDAIRPARRAVRLRSVEGAARGGRRARRRRARLPRHEPPQGRRAQRSSAGSAPASPTCSRSPTATRC